MRWRRERPIFCVRGLLVSSFFVWGRRRLFLPSAHPRRNPGATWRTVLLLSCHTKRKVEPIPVLLRCFFGRGVPGLVDRMFWCWGFGFRCVYVLTFFHSPTLGFQVGRTRRDRMAGCTCVLRLDVFLNQAPALCRHGYPVCCAYDRIPKRLQFDAGWVIKSGRWQVYPTPQVT